MTAANLGAIVFAQMQPHPDLIPGLAPCGDQYCYRAIQVGSTTHQDAQSLLRDTPGLANVNGWIYQFAPGEGMLTLSVNGGKVTTLELFMYNSTVSAGDIVGRMGLPCRAEYDLTTGEFQFIYPDLSVVFLKAHTRSYLNGPYFERLSYVFLGAFTCGTGRPFRWFRVDSVRPPP
jgi:hypothetical protein